MTGNITHLKKNIISTLFSEFFESEKTGGFILMFCTIVSIFVANSIFGEHYVHFWHQTVDLSFLGIQLNYSIQHWVNDGLMTIFFLLVGLEIERELYIGELSIFQNASLPVMAALGGIVVPTTIHYILNHGTPAQSGVGIPMATDIAFALGVLALIGNRVPVSLKIFLTALAIIDDLGAIIVIAIFYSKDISIMYLTIALGIFSVLLVFNMLKFHRIILYLALGLMMWYCMLKSGIHATITGVLLAFVIPFTEKDNSPSFRLQHLLHKPVAFIILPLFAMANTAVSINYDNLASLLSLSSLGIMCGLMFGKPLGILSFSLLAIMLKLGQYPKDTNWRHILGIGILGGIGFTMSIFITNLAFTDNQDIQNSIIAILIASLLSGIFGFIFFRSIHLKVIK
jgi:NhaA family Na+:H+ antiporter